MNYTSKMLSGEQLVAKGVTKIDAKLPEIGLKDVFPNGSWLEQKQIQSALEARKHLIEVERIEKRGTLSHAIWRDDLNLAEVTQQTGGYWQYFGCHIGKKLYLKPEEILFLMEINSLQLKHNEVTVSLQKSYSLLLNDTLSILQYKVYSSLSRLGYKVYVHKEDLDKLKKETESKIVEQADNMSSKADIGDNQSCSVNNINVINIDTHIGDQYSFDTNEMQSEDGDVVSDTNKIKNIASELPISVNSLKLEESTLDIVEENVNIIGENNLCKAETKSDIHNSDGNIANGDDVTMADLTIDHEDLDTSNNISAQTLKDNAMATFQNSEIKQNCFERDITYNAILLRRLLNRKIKPSNNQHLHIHFENIPDLYHKSIVTINVPKDDYIPKNIFVNNTSYVLNLDSIILKNMISDANESTYNASDEVNESLRRIRNSSRLIDTPQFSSSQLFFENIRPRMYHQFRPFNFWRPRHNLNYFQFNMFCQRPYLHTHFMPRMQFNQRMNNFLRQFPNVNYFNGNNSLGSARKRSRDEKEYHLRHIKLIAARFKHTILMGNGDHFNIQSLNRLIFSYNTKFRSRLRLTDDFEVVDDSVVETIELEDEVESRRKKPRLEEDTFKDNLDELRKMALKLKTIEEKETISPRLRRAFSKSIKTFNKSYSADVYLNEHYEIIDRRHITLDSSSDSDCIVNESEQPKKKILRNPFSLLKSVPKLIDKEQPSTSQYNPSTCTESLTSNVVTTGPQDKNLTHVFDENWLPNSDDFGTSEVVPKIYMNARIVDTYNDELLYDFIKSNPEKYGNWLDAKIAFEKYVEESNMQFKKNQSSTENFNESGLAPIIGPSDCTNIKSVLNKLRIIHRIGTDKEEIAGTRLKINFDVYNRDVQNFKKSNRPKPHFRVICINESSTFPSGEDISGLRSKYQDGVAIVFAVVSISSISYLQINPIDLPVYIPTKDVT